MATAAFSTSCDAAVKYISTASGLKYRDLVVGKGPIATKGDIILNFDCSASRQLASLQDRRWMCTTPVG